MVDHENMIWVLRDFKEEVEVKKLGEVVVVVVLLLRDAKKIRTIMEALFDFCFFFFFFSTLYRFLDKFLYFLIDFSGVFCENDNVNYTIG